MSKDEAGIEQEIQAKGLNAPRLKPEDIDVVIKEEHYVVMPTGTVMICQLVLKNGFTVTGEAGVVSRENFNYEIGKKISRTNARDKIWQLEGYLLRQRVFEGK